MERPIAIDFLEKGATVNSVSDCQLLKENSPYLLNDPHILNCKRKIISQKQLMKRNKKIKKKQSLSYFFGSKINETHRLLMFAN